jgi:RNA polymerase sigma-70 factor (ECF subfamily)
MKRSAQQPAELPCLAAVSDAQLVDGARRGDRGSLDQLFARYRDRIYRTALRLTGNHAEAEEATQDACLQVFRRLDAFDGRSQFSTWLYRVVVNAALMRQRQARRRPVESLDDYLPDFNRDGRHKRIDVDYSAAARIEQVVERRELSALVVGALARLTPALRAAVVLYDLEELPTNQAARVLGIDAATLRQRVHRARLMLRGFLEQSVQGDVR